MRRYIMILSLLFVFISVSACQKDSKSDKNNIEVNQNIVLQRNFNVSSDSTELNTSAEGTIFIKEVEGTPKQIKIVAWIEIDHDDRSGVQVYIPKEWSITNIINSYPGKEDSETSTKSTAIWSTTSDKVEWDKYIAIGRSSSFKPTGGGTGTFVIDLALDEEVISKPDLFNIMVAVGSDERDDVKISGADSIEISIPLIEN